MESSLAVQTMLAGMPTANELCRSESNGRVLIAVGATVIFDFAVTDSGMRNVAAVTLPELGFTGRHVAQVLRITEEYVSILRGRARREGSSALVGRLGRPPALGPAQLADAVRARAGGEPDTEIAARLGVHATTVARALVRAGQASPEPETQPAQQTLIDLEETSAQATGPAEATGPTVTAASIEVAGPVLGSSRIREGMVRSRYGGAMLLYAYMDAVGVEAIFSTLSGAPARRYDDLGVLSAATIGLALGVDTIEGVKHLVRADAGAVVGLSAIPELATLRSRLGALGDGCDPLALQRAFAKNMLSFDPADEPVYYVDDHFVAYAGAAPVAKGWNTRRRHAEAGRDDTLVVDARGRAVVFSTSAPTGLSSNLPGVLAQLRQVTGPKVAILVGFDRGGAYPVAFRACAAAGADWVTYRRAPLVQASTSPKASWTVRDHKRIVVSLADEIVEIKNYGPARQLTLFEGGQAVLQVLTSDRVATGAGLLCWLRSRWRIENVFKYAAAHNGINALADYRTDINTDTRMITNPVRLAARADLTAAETALVAAERALPQLLAGPGTPGQKNAALPAASLRIEAAHRIVEAAAMTLQPIPAKVAANEVNPDARLARHLLPRRGLQMVLRLLAFNAEAWVAEHFNAYLADPNEYRGLLRNLLHQGATIAYATETITVTLDRPDSPRVARALGLLAEELNVAEAHLPGDPRPITYQLADA